MAKRLTVQEKARRLWVRALRSGKYGWGRNELHPKENRYCCLGVLCEVAIKKGVINSYVYSDGAVPVAVQEWVGLTSMMGDFDEPVGSADTLAVLNDESKRNPFGRIANLIEKRPSGLFVEEELH